MEVFERLKVKKLNPSLSYKVLGKLTTKIYKARRKSDNKIYAMKTIDANKLKEGELLKLKNELVALAKLRSDFSVRFIEAFYFKGTYFVITELVQGDHIADVIRKRRGNLSEEFCQYILYCIA